MRQQWIFVAAAALVLAGCTSSAEPAPISSGARTPAPLATTGGTASASALGQPKELVTGLAVPWAIAYLPGGDALVTERNSARLLRITAAGRVQPVGTVPGVQAAGEGGLMGVAVSPSYDQDKLVFLYFTAADDNRVVRARYDGGRLGALQPIVTGIPKGANHNGGRLAVGPDKMLYIATGEVYQTELAQDLKSLGGKILRVTLDGKAAPGNPFDSRVWTYGHRNVQGLAFDDKGRLYATEFGQNRFDEINLIEKGKNYGWPEVEGTGGGDRYTDPLLTWSTEEASPSGLAFAGGSLWAAALRGARLWQVPLAADGSAGRPIAHYQGEYGRLRAVVRAPDGSLWVSTSNKDGRGRPNEGDDKILSIPLQ